MPVVRILMMGAATLALFGQTPKNAVPNPGEAIKRAVRGPHTGSLGVASPTKPFLLRVTPLSGPGPIPAESPCAVPLIEMKVPGDKNFTLQEFKAPPDFTDQMPAPRAMPACSNAAK